MQNKNMGTMCDEEVIFEMENKRNGGKLEIVEVGYQDYNDKFKQMLRLDSEGIFLDKIYAKMLIKFLMKELKIDVKNAKIRK